MSGYRGVVPANEFGAERLRALRAERQRDEARAENERLREIVEAAKRVRAHVGTRKLSDGSMSTSVVGPSAFAEFDALVVAAKEAT